MEDEEMPFNLCIVLQHLSLPRQLGCRYAEINLVRMKLKYHGVGDFVCDCLCFRIKHRRSADYRQRAELPKENTPKYFISCIRENERCTLPQGFQEGKT